MCACVCACVCVDLWVGRVYASREERRRSIEECMVGGGVRACVRACARVCVCGRVCVKMWVQNI